MMKYCNFAANFLGQYTQLLISNICLTALVDWPIYQTYMFFRANYGTGVIFLRVFLLPIFTATSNIYNLIKNQIQFFLSTNPSHHFINQLLIL